MGGLCRSSAAVLEWGEVEERAGKNQESRMMKDAELKKEEDIEGGRWQLNYYASFFLGLRTTAS